VPCQDSRQAHKEIDSAEQLAPCTDIEQFAADQCRARARVSQDNGWPCFMLDKRQTLIEQDKMVRLIDQQFVNYLSPFQARAD
jgi:hypothetical protein